MREDELADVLAEKTVSLGARLSRVAAEMGEETLAAADLAASSATARISFCVIPSCVVFSSLLPRRYGQS